MNYDTIYHILLKIDNIPDLRNFCRVYSLHSRACKENVNMICKSLLEHYQVSYKDPNNFIYVYNNEKQENFHLNEKWDYRLLFKY